jgi:peptide deformylase
MSILPIYNCSHPILKKKTEDIQIVDDNIKKLVDDMFETMYVADGVGLAANQIGISKSLIVIDISHIEENLPPPLTLINPKIEYYSEELSEYQEGCLSVPLFYEKVLRPKIIQVKYFDIEMKEHNLEADDYLARVIQHEYDHLQGILFYEKLSPVRKALSKSKIRKIQKGQVEAKYEMVFR